MNNAGLVLTVLAGNSLNVSGDLILTSGTFNTAAVFPDVTGTVDVSGGTVGFTGSGAQTIPAYNYYNLVSNSTGSRTLSSSGNIGISGSFAPGTNTYVILGSTIDFNSSGAQNIAAFNYNNLILDNAGIKTFNNGTSGIAGTLTIAGTAIADAITNSATISYNGSTNQSVTDIPYYNLDATSSGGIVTLMDATIGNNLSVTTGTMSIGTNTIGQEISVSNNLNIAGGASLNAAVTSNATHQLTIGGDVTNNGTLNLKSGTNNLCNTIFNKNGIQTIAGSGTTTSFNNITIDMGVMNTNHVDVTATNFSAPSGFLTLLNGSFNLNNSNLSVTPFTVDIPTGNFLVPANAGLWVNAGTINSPDMNWTVAGLVKVTGGTFNMGNNANNLVLPQNSAHIIVTSGILNLASAISNPGAQWVLDMKGGLMTINTLGSSTSGIAPFNMDAVGAELNMSGGTLVIQNAGGSTGQNLGYYNLSTSGTGFTGGVLQLGNASTTAAQSMQINSTNPVYNLTINSQKVAAELQTANLTVSNNVTVAAGSFNINDNVLTIGGNISNSDTFKVSSGTIVMNGGTAQNIPALAFTGNLVKNLTVDNNAGVTLNGTLSLSDVLLATSGQFNTGGYLTLLSTATQTALVDGSGTGEVLGNVTMQRYLPSAFGYKYFSSPFMLAKVNEFSDEVNLNASFPAFYRYDENQPSSGWVNYTDTTNLLIPLQGYAAQMGLLTTAKTVAITGVVNNNDQSSPTLYNHNLIYTQGFNLIGNPYPSPIDWSAGTGWTRSNIDDAIYYFNAGTSNQYTGTYSSYINGTSSDGIAGSIIAAMQGFFVHVTNGTFPVAATLTINNHARINNLDAYFHKPNPLTVPLVRLNASFLDETTTADPVVIYFDNEAKKTFEQELDALKLINTDTFVPSLYVNAPGPVKLSICAWPGLQDSSDLVPLGLRTKRSGWVTFSSPEVERIPPGWNIYLYDAATGIRKLLDEKMRYRIHLEAADYESRFFLLFNLSQMPALAGIFNAYILDRKLNVYIGGLDGAKCDVTLTNMLGQVLFRKQFAHNGHYELDAVRSSGVYIVSFYVQKHVFSQKIFIGNNS
ncbi:T9SS type A sorting domain-containing protein [Sphingobacterium sp. KU25419]|nr:T9SS type A sorting domain-containing protein [Sphingobacterium sp. KU25419]